MRVNARMGGGRHSWKKVFWSTVLGEIGRRMGMNDMSAGGGTCIYMCVCTAVERRNGYLSILFWPIKSHPTSGHRSPICK